MTLLKKHEREYIWPRKEKTYSSDTKWTMNENGNISIVYKDYPKLLVMPDVIREMKWNKDDWIWKGEM